MDQVESTTLNTDLYPKVNNLVLELFYHQNTTIIAPEQTPFQIGRDDSSGLPVSSEFASRQHCAIEYHDGKFTLRDHSRNGTFVQINLTPIFRIRDELTPLIGTGCFKLGADIATDDDERIFFKVKPASQIEEKGRKRKTHYP